MGRRVLVIGAGAREHALAWRLANSPSVAAVEAAPGNPGLAELGPCHPIQPMEPVAVARLAEQRRCDLVVVGPEAPLVAGLADEVRRYGIPVFGPTAAAARIEASKWFAKEIMAAAGVPTGRAEVYSDAPAAIAALDASEPPFVLKADGLAAGKGVVLAETRAEAVAAVEDALVRRAFGAAGERLLVEEYLEGPEVSVFAVSDGRDAIILPPARDLKRVYDGDRGPNTGGMGAFTPVPGFRLGEAEALRDRVFCPVLDQLHRRGHPYVGVLYAGLVLTADGPKVLEFNCRFGDPEAQVVLPRIRSDLAELLQAATDPSRGMRNTRVTLTDEAVVTVVLASRGYPGSYTVGMPISGLDAVAAEHPNVLVFHAGTRREDGQLVTAGGRVLSVTGSGPDLHAARQAAYAAADRIHFDGLHRRDDIALEAVTT